MPDLLSHYLIAKISTTKIKSKPISLFFVGTILPDLLGRTPFVVIADFFERYDCYLGWFLAIFHSPFVLILVCLLISFLFEETLRRHVFKLLFLGSALHLGLDMLQKTFTPSSGYLWFFPFSFKSFNIPLFWADQSIYLIPVLLAIIVFLWWSKPDEGVVEER